MQNKIKKNFFWNTLGAGFNALTSLFLMIIVVRINGSEISGIWAFTFSIACFFQTIVYYSGRTFQVTNNDEDLTDFDFLYQKFILIFISLFISILFLLIKQYDIFKNTVLILLLLFRFIESFYDSIYSVIQKNGDLYKVGISMLLKSIFGIIVFGITDYIFKNIIIATILYITIHLIFTIFYDLPCAKGYLKYNSFNFQRISKLLKLGFSTFVLLFFMQYILNIPKYYIDEYLTNDLQTIYSVIIMPASVLTLCSQFIIQPSVNIINNHIKEKKYFDLKKVVYKMCLYVLIIGIIFFFGTYLVGVPVLNFIYGIKLNPYFSSLLFIIIGSVFYAIVSILSTTLVALRKSFPQVLMYIATCLLITFLSYNFIKHYQIYGASISYMVSMIALCIMYMGYFIYYIKKIDVAGYKININKINYISFDIFDTLVKRNVLKPIDVFKIVEKKYNAMQKNKITDFVNKRVEAQKNLYNKSKKEEITIEEIYVYLKKYYNDSILKELIKIERETEINICVPNKKMVEFYNYCLNNKKKVIITSDMYLDEKTIISILDKCKIKNYYKLYLSSSLYLTKRTGSLFKYIKNDLNSKSIIHIGDNIINDYFMPKINGLKSKKIKIKNKKYNDFNSLNNFISNQNSNDDYYFNFGYSKFGPVLYGFVNWLNCKNKSEIFFLSRDGYLMQKAFNIINNSKKSNYFYASRRALIVPTLWKDKNLKEMMDRFHFDDLISVKKVFTSFGIELNVIKTYALNCKIDIDQMYSKKEFLNNESIKILYNDLFQKIVENSKNEYEILLKYIKQEKLKNDSIIVDIGWNGNMQKALCNILGDKIEGYYVGVSPMSNNYFKYNMNGFLFEPNKNNSKFIELSAINSIFESLFLAPHGSVKKYAINGKKIEPVLYHYEYDESRELNYYKSIQDGALKFVEDYNNSDLKYLINLDDELSFENIKKFALKPTYEDANNFGDFKFLDGEEKFIAKPKKNLIYIFNPKCFISDFFKADWKIGFLKRVFKINLFYDKLYLWYAKKYLKKEN